MRCIVAGLALAVAGGFVHPAVAADIPVKAIVAQAYNWTGFYAGVHAGWGLSDPTGTSTISAAGVPALTARHDLGANGPLFGGHAGYNWQINPGWVAGIEGDITGTGIKAFGAQVPTCGVTPPGGTACPGTAFGALSSMSQEVNWLASVRGRFGTAWGPGLLYVTGGVAWANVDLKAASGDSFYVCSGAAGCGFTAASNVTKTGWTVGGGYEAALAGNWTVRAEYLYYSFGGSTLAAAANPAASCGAPPCTASFAFPDLKLHTVRLGLTYKLGEPAGAPMAAFVPPARIAARSWTGFYAGVHAGWGFGNSAATSTLSTSVDPATYTAQHDLGANGPLFGGHAGYNWQINPALVAGIEGDITGSGIKAASAQTPLCSATFCGTAQTIPGALMSMSQEVNWLASIRGRLGATWGPGLIYVTGGAAWANVDYKANGGDSWFICGSIPTAPSACQFPATSSTTKTGWVVGGGYEAVLIGNWTVRAEYLYYAFGGETLTAAGTPAASCIGGGDAPCTAIYAFPDLKIHTARLGVSYRF